MRKGIHALHFFARDKLQYVKAFDFASKGGVVERGIELGNRGGATGRGHHTLPELVFVVADGAHNTDAGNNDSGYGARARTHEG